MDFGITEQVNQASEIVAYTGGAFLLLFCAYEWLLGRYRDGRKTSTDWAMAGLALGALALVGGVADTSALASSLTLQAAALHSPEDLVMAAAVSPRRGMAGWLKWLPHCRAASSPLAVPSTMTSACDRSSRPDAGP